MSRLLLILALLALAACGWRSPAPVVYGSAEPQPEVAVDAGVDGLPPVPPPKPGASLGGEVVVAPGDTVYAIARRNGVAMRSLIDLNGLQAPYTLRVGQTLRLPEEYLYQVVAGDTLSGIARRYDVSMRLLAQVNGLADPFVVTIGQRLRIPVMGGTVVATPQPQAAGAVVVAAPPEPDVTGTATVAVEADPIPTVAIEAEPAQPPSPEPVPDATAEEPEPAPAPVIAAVPQPEPRSAARFAWPVQGTIVSSFGPKPDGLNNDGINIAAPRGASVVAAENGVVVYAGNEIPGFGNLVLIRHADGWATAYAHNETLLVGKGDQVARGQPIARVGATGSVREPQSHFEIRKGNEPVNPIKYLSAN